MDYLLELARDPDLQQAITITAGDDGGLSAGARRSLLELQRVSFLATQHPNAWTTEVLHTLYEHPDLARAVWVNLRYADRNRTVIASRDLMEESLRTSSWISKVQSKTGAATPQAEEASRPRGQFVAQFKERPFDAVSEYSKALGNNRQEVERLCRETAAPPDPPTFLGDLMAAEGTAPKDRDERTQQLLREPAQVRNIAREKQIAIPFSMVQEAELAQINHVRKCVRPPSGEAVDAAADRAAAAETQPPAPRRHSARLALDMNLLGLAFSGGGIRSATFNLGVLQGLSKIGLLKQVDYLSTVSGGGYIGSWLAA